MDPKRELQKTETDGKIEMILDDFNSSFETDKRFFLAEIEVNLAYCEALFQAGILNRIESDKIKNTLQTIEKRASFDSSYFENFPAKNIQDFVIARLFQLIGDTALKLLTGRTRTEQIATVFRVWLRKEIEKISKTIAGFQKTLIQKCFENKDAVIPGYLKDKNVHPILFAHWGLAYFEMFSRDRERLDEVWRRVNVLPLGAGNLAGTSYEIDYDEIARDLGFEGLNTNSLDIVSDRDFAIEFVDVCSLIILHLSRFASELNLYSIKPNSFIYFKKLSDSTRLNSEKINDALRKISAATGEFSSIQMELFSKIKESSVSRDFEMEEIHKPVFKAVDRTKELLMITESILSTMFLNKDSAKIAATKDFQNSDAILDYLVNLGVSFGTATNKVREIIAYVDSNNKKLENLSLEEFKNFSNDFDEDIFETLSLENTLKSKKQIGGTSPERVFEALEKAKEGLERE